MVSGIIGVVGAMLISGGLGLNSPSTHFSPHGDGSSEVQAMNILEQLTLSFAPSTPFTATTGVAAQPVPPLPGTPANRFVNHYTGSIGNKSYHYYIADIKCDGISSFRAHIVLGSLDTNTDDTARTGIIPPYGNGAGALEHSTDSLNDMISLHKGWAGVWTQPITTSARAKQDRGSGLQRIFFFPIPWRLVVTQGLSTGAYSSEYYVATSAYTTDATRTRHYQYAYDGQVRTCMVRGTESDVESLAPKKIAVIFDNGLDQGKSPAKPEINDAAENDVDGFAKQARCFVCAVMAIHSSGVHPCEEDCKAQPAK